MHDIERELIKATGYKAARKFADRQDYLKSILNSVSKLADEDFDLLSDEASEWANAAVEAHNSKDGELPDFDELAPSDPDDEEEAGSPDDEPDEDEADDADEDAEAGDEAEDELPHDQPDPDDKAEDDTDEDAVDEDDPDEEDDEDPEPPVKKGKKPVAKSAPKPVAKPAKAAKEPAKAKPAVKAKKASSRDDEEDVITDKWGAMEGSKNSRALAMFEKGATTKEIKDALGGTYYNILKKMVENGHKLSKEGAVVKLTHKDESAKPKAAAKKKK